MRLAEKHFSRIYFPLLMTRHAGTVLLRSSCVTLGLKSIPYSLWCIHRLKNLLL